MALKKFSNVLSDAKTSPIGHLGCPKHIPQECPLFPSHSCLALGPEHKDEETLAWSIDPQFSANPPSKGMTQRGCRTKRPGPWLVGNNPVLDAECTFTTTEALPSIVMFHRSFDYPHFTDKETETGRLSDFPQITHLGSDRARSRPRLILLEMAGGLLWEC